MPASERRPIIGLAGRSGSGKSTAASHFGNFHGFLRVRFADPLKDMARALGLNEEHIEGGLKELPCTLLCGKTPRWFMQTIGTEFGREMVGPDFWVRAWSERVRRNPAMPIVAEDVRFPNEAAEVRRLGGIVIRVTREAVDSSPIVHKSESYLAGDIEVPNDGTVEQFAGELNALYARLLSDPEHIRLKQIVASLGDRLAAA